MGLLLAPAEGFGLQPRLFFALRAIKELFMLFWPIFGNFWCLVVIVVTFSGNLSNFERNQKKTKKSKRKKRKKFKKIKKIKKIQKSQKIQKIQKKIKKEIQKIQKKSIKKPKNQNIVKNGQKIRKSPKISKIHLFFCFVFSLKKILPEKKCYPLSFPILGGRDSTRAL